MKRSQEKQEIAVYSDAVADEICGLIATTNLSLRSVCKALNLHGKTVWRWLAANEEFARQYALAKEAQADLLVEEILDIADDATHDTIQDEHGPKENREWVNRSKLRIESRKWIAAKLKPKKYGDRAEFGNGTSITPFTGFVIK